LLKQLDVSSLSQKQQRNNENKFIGIASMPFALHRLGAPLITQLIEHYQHQGDVQVSHLSLARYIYLTFHSILLYCIMTDVGNARCCGCRSRRTSTVAAGARWRATHTSIRSAISIHVVVAHHIVVFNYQTVNFDYLVFLTYDKLKFLFFDSVWKRVRCWKRRGVVSARSRVDQRRRRRCQTWTANNA